MKMTRTSINFWLDVASLLVMLGLVLTGGLIHFVLPPGTGHTHFLLGLGRHDFGQIHFYLAVAAVVLLALHVLLHWNWICCVIGKAFGHPRPSRTAQMAWGMSLLVGVALLSGAGYGWAVGNVQKCPSGAAISGRTRLGEVAEQSGMSVEQLRERLNLPARVGTFQRLGRLRRWYGLSLNEVRQIVCRAAQPAAKRPRESAVQ